MLLTHVQSKGWIEVIEGYEEKGFFRFCESIAGQKKSQEFKDEKAFHAYLASRKDVDSWIIKNNYTQHCIYKYRNSDGIIEHFNCEEDLYREISEKSDGSWKLIETWRKRSAFQPVYMLDESNGTTRSYRRCLSREEFQIARMALEIENQFNGNLNQSLKECIIL